MSKLKNYKSSASMPNIFRAIEKTLAEHKAKQITRNYDDNGRIISMSFVVETSRGFLTIKLPAKFDKVEKIFIAQGIRYKEEQPYRTAWATIRDWVDAQMALVEWEMVKPEEVFLPYAVTKTGKTYFEEFEDGKLLLE